MHSSSPYRWLAGLALAVGVTAFVGIPVQAQQINTEIRGTVTGMDGKPLPGATMTFIRTDVPGKFTEKTDKKGQFDYHTLPQGTYDISVTTPDGKEYPVGKGARTSPGGAILANADIALLSGSLTAGVAPPPGMTPEEAAAYMKKVKDAQASSEKVGQLNTLLKQNKEFVDAKQYDKAIGVMEQAVALDQTKDILFANLGEDYDGAKQYDKAAEAYQKASTLKPRDANYLINLGTAQLNAGKMDDANAAFAKANAIDPKQTNLAMYNTGVVLINQGKMDAAGATFDKLLTLDPNNADAWYYKGVCLLGSANANADTNKQAADALKKSLQLAPNGPNAAVAKQALQSLGGGI